MPDDSIKTIEIDILPANWRTYPAPIVFSEIVERWVKEGETIVFRMPSCIIYSPYNLIFNCRHKRYRKVKLIDKGNFEFNSRFKK